MQNNNVPIALVLILAVVGVVIAGGICASSGFASTAVLNDNGLTLDNPKANAGAQATISAYQLEATSVAIDNGIKQDVARASIEATRVAVDADAKSKVIVAGAQAETNRQNAQALGIAGTVSIIAVGIAFAVAILVLSVGFSIAYSRNAILKSQYAQFNVNPNTMMLPLVISSDGWIVNTMTNERALLRSVADVDALVTSARAHASELKLLGDAEVRISQVTKSSKTADALMSGAASLPVLVEGKE